MSCQHIPSQSHPAHKNTTQESPSPSNTEEAVLAVLAGRYFNARKEQAHLRDALRAVITASAGSLNTIQFLTDVCAADRDFVAKIAFQSESLTPKVASWIIDWINQQDRQTASFVDFLVEFVCGNAPLCVGHLLLQHVDCNSPCFVGVKEYPVWLACLANSKAGANDMRLLLVFKRANDKWRDDQGRPVLHFAAFHGQLGITKYLVNHLNVDVNEQDGEGHSALMFSIWDGHTEVATFLALSPFANLELKDEGSHNALQHAALFNRLEVVIVLVNELNIDVNHQDGLGHSALMTAIRKGHLDVAKFLALHPFALLDLQDEDGHNALHFAALNNQLEVAYLLVNERSVDVNQQDGLGFSALMIAIVQGHTELAKFLALHPFAQLELQNANGWNALQIAAHFGHMEVIRILENRRNGA